MLDAFKVKKFGLQTVFSQWKDGPIFAGNPKKDMPVGDWLDIIKKGCLERRVPEKDWPRVAENFMGARARVRLDEFKQVIADAHIGKYKWTWKRFKIAMLNMNWANDDNEVRDTFNQRRCGRIWFADSKAPVEASLESSRAKPPASRQESMWIVVEKPDKLDAKACSKAWRSTTVYDFCSAYADTDGKESPQRITKAWRSTTVYGFSQAYKDTEDDKEVLPCYGYQRPGPDTTKTWRSTTVYGFSSSCINTEDEFQHHSYQPSDTTRGWRSTAVHGFSPAYSVSESDEEATGVRSYRQARPKTMIVLANPQRSTTISRMVPGDERDEAIETNTNAPGWLQKGLDVCSALDFITRDEPMSIISAILIALGSIPAIPSIAAGAGGALLASDTARALGFIAVGVGRALTAKE